MSASRRGPQLRLPKPLGSAWRLLLIGAGLLAAAINTGNNLLYLLFSLLVATLPVTLLVAGNNLRGLRAQLLPFASPLAGAPAQFRVRLTRSGRWTASRSVRVTLVSSAGEFGPAALERLEPGAATVLAIPARAPGRGPHRIERIRVQTSFPLGLALFERSFDVEREWLVLTRATHAGSDARGSEPLPGDAGRTAHVAGSEYAGLKQGTDHDDMRRVDWKASARRGRIMLRETAGEARPRLELVLRTCWSGPGAQARQAFERQISGCAAAATRALDRGGQVRLTHGDTCASFAGAHDVSRIERYLARIEPVDAQGRPLPISEPERRPPAAAPADARRDAPRAALRLSSRMALLVSVAGLTLFGGIGIPAFLVLAASIALTGWSRRWIARPPALGGRLWHVAGVIALGVFVLDLLLVRRNPLAASLNLVLFITMFAVFTARNSRDDAQILLVSLLHLILAAALTTELSFAPVLVAWLLCTVHGQIATTMLAQAGGPRPVALSLAAGIRGPRYAAPSIGVATLLLAASAPAYLLIPHLGTGTFRPGTLRAGATSGFSETTRLGDIGRIKLDNSRVMEIEVEGPLAGELDLRWRGVVLDRFDGQGWSLTRPDAWRLRVDDAGDFYPESDHGQAQAAARTLLQRVRLEPNFSRVLFAAARPQRVRTRDFDQLEEDSSGALRLKLEPRRRVHYEVRSTLATLDAARLRAADGADPQAIRAQYLELPRLDARVEELARRLTVDARSRFDAAQAIERWLSTRLAYSLNVNDRERADPLAAFLFEGMSAHCEYFATSMVLLARASGIPARFVGGYLRGEKQRFARGFVVRQSDAHSWVEVYFQGIGWVPFDPTPSAGRGNREDSGLLSWVAGAYTSLARVWDDYFVGIDLDDQFRGWLAVRAWFGSAVDAGWYLLRARVVWIAIVLPQLALLLRAAWRRHRDWLPSGTDRARCATPIPRFYRRTLGLLARRGLRRGAAETATEFALRAGRAIDTRAARALDELTALYQQARFGGGSSDAVRGAAATRLAELRRELRRAGPGLV